MSGTALVNESAHDYTMRISRLTIDKLGIRLYDRVSAVLAELIANSYDADARSVTVTLPWGTMLAQLGQQTSSKYEIVVEDNGHGMTKAEVNAQYLMVGADRRKRTGSDKSRELDRPVMGRKGIGKLAPFGICQTIEVITSGSRDSDKTADGWPVAHLLLHLPDMLNDTEDDYHPQPGLLDGTYRQARGTTVKLRDFVRKRVPSGEELNRQLAARFGLQRDDWHVTIVDSETEGTGSQFVLGDLNIDVLEDTRIIVDNRPVAYDSKSLPVHGWVAYSKRPYKDEAMAGVRIFARGKLVAQTRDFGIGAGFTGEFKLRSYLIGAIHAEWLDADDDLVRSDRQDILWNSELGEALSAWGQKLLRDLGARGETSVRKQTWDEFVEVSKLPKRLEEIAPNDGNFRDSVTEAAKLLVDNKDRAALSDKDHVDRVVQLALTLGPQRDLLEALREVADTTDTTFDAIVSLFDKARISEMYALGQVAAERVHVVERLETLIKENKSLERPFQELIEQAPWLLAPEWTPLGMNESLKRVRAAFEAWYMSKHKTELVTTAIGSGAKEPDFVLLHDAGVLWIVEIKRMDHHLTDPEYQRALNYLEALTEFLEQNPAIGKQFPIRRLTFVADHGDKLGVVSRSSLEKDDRVDRRSWHELLDSTKRAHKDFLTKVYELQTKGVTV